MLVSLKLTYFRQHTDLFVGFVEGINLIKAPNEGGKSTMIEAILYALFGSKSLRDSLSDVVTWGYKETDLNVDLVIQVEGELFNFTRGKSGAECKSARGIVTGQNEVSNFSAQLLGADANAANKLMMASQTSVRGALEEGPKALAVLIENLANFDLFDKLMAAFDTQVTTGPTTALEARIADTRTSLEAAAAELIPPDTTEKEKEITFLEGALNSKADEVAIAEQESQAAQVALEVAEAQLRAVEEADNDHKAAEALKARHEKQLAEAKERAVRLYSDSELSLAQASLVAAQDHAKTVGVYKSFRSLIYPEDIWEGSKASFLVELEQMEATDAELKASISAAKTELEALSYRITATEKLICTDTTCPTCKQELKDASQILASNQENAEVARKLKIELLETEDKLAGFRQSLAESSVLTMKAIAKSGQDFENYLIQYGEHYVDGDLNFYPPKLSWRGVVPESTAPDVERIKTHIRNIEADKTRAMQEEAMISALHEALVDDDARLVATKGRLDRCVVPLKVQELETAKHVTAVTVSQFKLTYKTMQEYLASKRLELQAEASKYEALVKFHRNLKVVLGETEAELETLQFNNALLKKVRAARPLISDKLWQSVLVSVSQMFTSMRGEQSIVTKLKEGFLVNGKPISSLSGSTLDLLGIAIRTSLCKMFIPHISLLVMDEAGAAMDSDREKDMLGFIASSGFKQVLLVSHDEITESFADNLITL